MIVAVDFDETLSIDGVWPGTGRPNVILFNILKSAQKDGDKIILWTCRTGDALNTAVEFCKENGLVFDAINENLPEMIDKFGNNTRKISADIYIDDKSLNPGDFAMTYLNALW